MCGIFGVLNYKHGQAIDRRHFEESTRLLAHRGPDGEGYFYDDTAGLGLGHRRLSILDLSTGDQPMNIGDGALWITFNGEIYNYLDVKQTLKARGHTFRTKSDTEVILAAYQEYGEECVNHLNGIFAFAIWDTKRKTLFAARDHFGVKPLYYADDGERLVFASELKSILHYTQMRRELDEEGLALCLNFRHIPAPYTLLKGVCKLPSAHTLSVRIGQATSVKRYWYPDIRVDEGQTEEEWIERLQESLSTAVKRQMMSDVPVGVSLSGGVDSGAILALMTKHAGAGVHAFTIGFEGIEAHRDEVGQAREHAKRYGAQFHERIVTAKDYDDFMNRYLWHLEEPIGNDAATAYYFVAEMAKGTVKVLLNGQGADEIFGGYDRYIGVHYGSRIPEFLAPVVGAAARLAPTIDRKRQLLQLADFLAQPDDAGKIASATGILMSAERERLLQDGLRRRLSPERLEGEVEKLLVGFTRGSVTEKAMYYDSFSLLSENLLLCEDKMAMAASIEARVPFLDLELAGLGLSIPARFKFRRASGKYLLKKVCEPFLPASAVHQPKIGFNNPVHEWLRTSMGDQLMDFLHSSASILRPYVHMDEFEKMFARHKRNEENNQFLLYTMLSIEKWATLFLNGRQEVSISAEGAVRSAAQQ
ncbi:MAG TPA: asparagine synthase (glutamine-hydrolyzing) [Bacteroidota bacterium]|nr:asparagine synthase (glutamine-hydrolyzing) [Bacteroidota bacterium]